jgi:VWFA-related protein
MFIRRATVAALALVIPFVALVGGVFAFQNGNSSTPATPAAALRITSPLGRTGLVTKVRIVAQITVPEGSSLSPVQFFVDGTPVGTVSSGPPYAVDWVDDDPFQRREIVVQASDSAGNVLRDSVVLSPYEVSEHADVTGILLETSVYDGKGRFVSDLEPSVFRVLEDGVTQTTDVITRETIPTDLVMLVDNSQSMSRRMDFVRLATERLSSTLRQGDTVVVAPFNAHVGTITGPTSDRATISEAVAAMRSGGGTAVFDSVLEGVRLLQGSENRRAIVLITDGYDENSKATIDDVLEAVERSQVTVYVVGVGGVAGISLKGEQMLKRIAQRSGGAVFFPPREGEIVTAAQQIATDTHSRYLITYTPTNQRNDGAWRAVSVEVPEGYRARTRAGYFAPEPPPIKPTREFAVTDAQHQLVDVTADDFEVLEDGVAQSVDTFQIAVDPVSIVMALDSSGSMKKSEEVVKTTATEFVREVRPEDSLALITFADKPRFAHVLAKNRDWTIDAIGKYVANGGTALYDAVWNSLLTLRDVPGRRAVVVFTDGRDENNPGTAPGSIHTLDDVLGLAKETGAIVYGVGLGTKVDVAALQRLADVSTGQVFVASDASDLGVQFKRVVESLRRRYVLGYTSKNSTHDGSWRTVEIRPRTPGYEVRSSGGYFAPEK